MNNSIQADNLRATVKLKQSRGPYWALFFVFSKDQNKISLQKKVQT